MKIADLVARMIIPAYYMAIAVLALPTLAFAQEPADQTAYVTAADVRSQVDHMRRSLKPGQAFMYQPLLRAGDASAALEYWTRPQKPAVHPDQAEYVTVLAGAGTLVSGGTMVDPVTTNPTLIEGSRIVGGKTRPLHVGDVFLVPAGTPHWFGITGGRLALLGTKIAQTIK